MTIRHLEYFFAPKSVALVGASPKPQSVGATVFANLRQSFRGELFAVNPHHRKILDLACYADVASLPSPPELAVICTPPASVPKLVSQLGEKGCKAAIVITGGFNGARTNDGRSLTAEMLNAARPHALRILGPNCLGILVPGIGLNASFAHTDGLPGKLAFVSQSGALATAVLDWSKARGIGFSAFITIGDAADTDLGDLLDYLASDPGTAAILLYIESVKNARKFMSAARAAARGKPVIAVKSGRASEASRAVASHTGALAGSDDVVDCALRRAGVLRVSTLQDLFSAAETLARAKPLRGDALTIVTNGGGAGVLATDALVRGEGTLAQLSNNTLDALNKVLPPTWSHGNPVDIIGDAPAQRYAQALAALENDPATGAILLMHAPTAIVSSTQIALACLPEIKESSRTILTCWLGENAVHEARQLFARENIPSYATPEQAVRAFFQLRDFRRHQELLMQTPPPLPILHSDATLARETISKVLGEGRTVASEIESKCLLSAYGIPVVVTQAARNTDEAVQCAERAGFPVALKILSPDITHKSDSGGVALGLGDAGEVRYTAQRMLANVRSRLPQARIEGFTVQKMVDRTRAHELIVGCMNDPVFGPVIMFGQGGTAVEVLRDRAFALPPLNAILAKDLISHTRVSKLLAGYRDRPAANEKALIDTLLKLSQLVCDHAQIAEIDINPLVADEHGVIALDARIVLARNDQPAHQRLAILPYPAHLAEEATVAGRPVVLRPIRAEDEPLHAAFLERLSPEDVHLRFFHSMRSWTHHQLARFTQIDYDREMAFVAVTAGEPAETLGVVRAIGNPDNTRAEFAIVVRTDLKGKGLGYRLMRKLIEYQKAKGTAELVGDVLASNAPMLKLARSLGFSVKPGDQTGVLGLSLPLN
ncbi:MAG: GNAT family N-acetyltransferase [Burkholderiales bacterium]